MEPKRKGSRALRCVRASMSCSQWDEAGAHRVEAMPYALQLRVGLAPSQKLALRDAGKVVVRQLNGAQARKAGRLGVGVGKEQYEIQVLHAT